MSAEIIATLVMGAALAALILTQNRGLRGEIAGLCSEVRSDIAEIRGEIRGLTEGMDRLESSMDKLREAIRTKPQVRKTIMLNIQSTVTRAKVNVADADTLVKHCTMTPNAVLLVVFAIELMLKVFSMHEGKEFEHTHKLGKLFGELNEDTRSSIERAALERRVPNVRSLLGKYEDAFMDWRYGMLEEGGTGSIPYDQFRWTYDALIEVWSKTPTA